MRLFAGAAMGLAVVGFAATASASALAAAQDARNCHLCLESASRQTFCENNDPSKPGFDFDCLCSGPGYVDITRGCSNFCADTEYGLPSQCPANLGAAKRDARGCHLCLESAARQTHCENNDPSKPGFDFDCLCSGPGYVDVTRGCANLCADTDLSVPAQCPAKVERAVSNPRECHLCLESAARQTHCENNDPFMPGFDFGCLCAGPSFSSVTRGCADFCADTTYAVPVQCPNDAKRAVSVGSARECTLCLEAASAKTSCADPSTPGFDFNCLCQPNLFNEVVGCTNFCASTPNDLTSQCGALGSTSTSTKSSPTLPPRDNILQTETMSPRFGFCGPKGVNCKSTEYARQVTTSTAAGVAAMITKTTDNLGGLFKRHANITKTVDNLATKAVRVYGGVNGTANSTVTTTVTTTAVAPTSFAFNSTVFITGTGGVASATEAIQSTTPLPSSEVSEGGASAVVAGKGIFAFVAVGAAFAAAV